MQAQADLMMIRARRFGEGANGAGQHSSGTGEIVWRTTARLQCAQRESGESRRLKSGTATSTGAAAVGHRRIQRTDLRVQRPGRSIAGDEVPASGAAEADQGRRHIDRADVLADPGRSASLPQEPRRRLLSGTAARTQESGTERSADAYQQGMSSII